jgi:predicted dithiol-disulfide isomerase involved in polyketide biosynthesis
MFQAFFQDDRDIGDEEVIVDVSRTLGLEATSVREAMASPARKRQHQADLAYATETMRITAVPGIVIDGTPLQGTPSATRLKKVVDALTTSKGCRP